MMGIPRIVRLFWITLLPGLLSDLTTPTPYSIIELASARSSLRQGPKNPLRRRYRQQLFFPTSASAKLLTTVQKEE
jgi:hypothetical protein